MELQNHYPPHSGDGNITGVEKTYASEKSMVKKGNGVINEFSGAFDYVVVFPMKEINDPDGSFRREQSDTAKHVMHAMLTAGLEIYPYLSVQDDELLVLFRAPLPVLQKFADTIDYKLKYDPAELNRVLEAGDEEHQIAPIHITHDPKITPIQPFEYIYMKYDEDFDPKLYYTEPGESSPFHKSVRLKLIYALLRAPKRQGGCDLELSKLILKKKILCLYPLHDREISDQLLAKCSAMKSFPWDIPTHDIKEYFGEKIALYNVFIGHYSYWLIVPSIIGFAFQLVVWITLNFSHPVLPFFSLVITVWSIIMLEYWKRRESTTAMYWGMLDFEKTELDRPEFKGELIKSYINGKDMLYFPENKQQARLVFSESVVITFICLVIGVVAGIYVLRFSLQERSNTSPYASLVASVLNTVQITIFNMIYQAIALKLTDRENHRTDTLYEDSMIVKLFIFQFINSYASFFFLAFIAGNLPRPNGAPDDFLGQCGATNCMEPLSINVAIIFGTRLTLTNFLDIFLPWLAHRSKLKRETKGIAEDKQLTPAEKDYMLLDYQPLVQSIQVYADTAIQYGFSLLFITALPCACACSLISNYFKIKFQAWKLFTFYQRPVPAGAQDIGTWQTIFSIISVVSVITNAGLICFTMDVLWQYSLQGRVWIFIGFQWVLIGIQFIAQAVIPDVPNEVEIQSERIEFITEKVVEKVADEDYGEAVEMEETNDDDDEEEGNADGVSNKTGGSAKGKGKGCCGMKLGGKSRGKKIKHGLKEVTVFPYPFDGAWPAPLQGSSGVSTEEIKAAIAAGSTGNTDGRSLGGGGYSPLPPPPPTYY